MNGGGKAPNNHTNSTAKQTSAVKSPPPLASPTSAAAAPPPVAAAAAPIARAPIRHRRLSVFNPKKFSAAVAAAVRKSKKNQKLAAAAVAAAGVVEEQTTESVSTPPPVVAVASIVSPAKLTLNAVALDAPVSRVNSSSRTASPNVAVPAAAAAPVSSGSTAKSILCDVCSVNGTPQDIVRLVTFGDEIFFFVGFQLTPKCHIIRFESRCDECKKNYHFQCLEPPVKKTPKRRGYSWHCADCDPTVSIEGALQK